jgi:hypothetical protein
LNGLKENIDDLLEYINKKTGIKITRNRFCISAFKFYFDALLKSENVNDMLKNMVDEE